MVNNDSLSDIFKVETSDDENSEFQPVTSSKGILCVGSNNTEVKACAVTENRGCKNEHTDQELVESEFSENSSSFLLHLSEEMNSDKHGSNRTSGESSSSNESYMSLNAPSLSSEDNKDSVISYEFPSGSSLYKNSPDMFAESGEISSAEQESYRPLEVKKENNNDNCHSSHGDVLQEFQSSQKSSQGRTSSDSENQSQIRRISMEEDSPKDFQCSQEFFQDPPEPTNSSRPNTPLDDREQHELWTSGELSRVSRRLELRKRQVRRLIMKVIRKRQMAKETLDAFKKRLKKF